MSDTIEIPRAVHRTTHTLTPREAAVVIVVAFAYVEEAHAAPEPYSAARTPFNPDWLCAKDMLHAARDGEGYHEHVTSLLGDDAIDYPDAVSATTDARLNEIVAALNAIEALDPDEHSISDEREAYLLDQPEFDVDRSTDYATDDRSGTWHTHDGARIFPANDGWTWER